MDLNVYLCSITIGAVSIKVTDHFSSIKYNITTDSVIGNLLEVTLFDDTDYIETLLLLSNREFTVEFPGRTPIRFSLLDVNPTYGQISSITFTGTSVGGVRADLKTRQFTGKKISEIVTEVIQGNNNWTLGEVEETEELLDSEGEIQSFTQSNESDLEFIRRLSQFAMSTKTGNFDFKVIVEDTVSKPIISFKPDNIEEEILTLRFSIGDVQNAKDGKVISYSPELSLISNAIIFNTENTSEVAEEGGQNLEPNTPGKEGINVLVGDDNDYTKVRTASLAEATSKIQFSASVELWGVDWKVYPTKVISVYAYRPNGTLHYSSGRYYVQSVDVDITGGAVRQTVNMYRSNSFFELTNSNLTDIAQIGGVTNGS